jgi:hypothetical protein
MDPLTILNRLLDTKSVYSTVILIGLSVLAAAAIAAGWFDGNLQTAVYISLYILGFSVMAIVISSLIGSKILRLIMGYLLVAFIFIILGIFTYSAAVADPHPFKPAPCLVRFWAECELIKDQLVAGETKSVPIQTTGAVSAASDQTDIQRGEYTVYVQFAGYSRETIVSLADHLANLGWRVPSSDKGGERLSIAAGLAQVRYSSSENRPAANALAADIRATGVNEQVLAVENPDIGADHLEVWIGLR